MLDFGSQSESDYRYGFQGQEKDDEIKGASNTTSAEHWLYDTRTGRRWNVDPIVKHHESPYAAFANNPIWFIDPFGADTTDATKENFYTKEAGNKGLLVFINDTKGYIDKEKMTSENEGWDVVVAQSWEEAQGILNDNFSEEKGTYQTLMIRTHGTAAGLARGPKKPISPATP